MILTVFGVLVRAQPEPLFALLERPAGCFVAGTQVLTLDGLVEIQSLDIGESSSRARK